MAIVYFLSFSLFAQKNNYELVQPFAELSSGRINSISKVGTDIWIATEQGLFVENSGSLLRFEPLLEIPILKIKRDKHYSIWVSTYDGRIFQIKDKEVATEIDLSTTFQEKLNREQLIIDFEFINDRTLLIISDQNQLFKLTIDDIILEKIPWYGKVNTIAKDKESKIWLGGDDGLFEFDKDSNNPKPLFASSEIFKISTYFDGILVVGVKNKKSTAWSFSYSELKWNKIRFSRKIRKNKVRNIVLGFDRKIWISTNILARFRKKNKWEKLADFGNVPVLSMELNQSNNGYFIGTEWNGLYTYRPEHEVPDTTEPKDFFVFQGDEIRLGEKHEIRKLLFEQDDSTLLQSSLKILDELSSLLLKEEKIFLLIEGHTSVGPDSDKLNDLSRSRAQSVKSFLVYKGVSEKRLSVTGYGAEYLKDKRHPHSDVNKRVEITLKNSDF